VICLCLLLVGALGAGGAVGYLTFLRAPANPPAVACAGGRGPDAAPVVVAAGASTTQGSLGADWVGALRERPEHRAYEFVNAGVNGSTAADLRQRADADIVACRPVAVVILIGTNDVRADTPVERYSEDLAALVAHVRTRTGARTALLSLPPLGEDLDAEINGRVGRFNAAIAGIARRAGIDYLPLNEGLTGLLRQRGGTPAPYDFGFPLAFGAAAQHYLLGRSWDEVARTGGRELLVDHVHLTDRAGAVVSGLVGDWLRDQDRASHAAGR
jgi:lysophospholipase L1-like esterase